MRDFATEHDIDLGASWAYSDSVSDLPMLRAVGHPVAVNPDAELAEIAAAKGWRVMRFERSVGSWRSPARRWSPPRLAARGRSWRAAGPSAAATGRRCADSGVRSPPRLQTL